MPRFFFLEQEGFICTLPGSHCTTCAVADSMFNQKPHKEKSPSAVLLCSESNMKKTQQTKNPRKKMSPSEVTAQK